MLEYPSGQAKENKIFRGFIFLFSCHRAILWSN